MEEKTSFNEIFNSLRKFWKAPEMIVFGVVVFMIGIIFIIQIFFEMSVFLFLASLILFFGVIVITLYSNLRALNLQLKSLSATKQLGMVVDDMDEGVIIYSPKFQIININPAAEKIFEVRKQDVLGKTISPDHVRHASLEALAQVMFPSLAPVMNQLSGNEWPQVAELETSKPALRLVVTLNRFVNENNETVSFVKIIKDKTREAQLIKTKNDFITTAAHQLRTPVTAISWGFEQLSGLTKDNPEMESIIEEGKNLTNRSLKIINDLLTVIQIEEGKFGYKTESVDVVSIIKSIINEAGLIAKNYGIEVKGELPEEEIKITADPERIIAVFSALVENAIMYNNPDGEVVVSVKNSDKPGFVEVSISDTGIGMSEEETIRAFEKFYRGKTSAQISPNGSGLGLYIAKNIVEAHKGKITISSTPNRGTVVGVWLPAQNQQ